MQIETMPSTDRITVSIAPADGSTPPNPAQGTLSNAVFTSSNPLIFTVAADPTNPLGAIVTGVAPGTANLLVTALATEPDASTHQVSDSAQIVLTAVAPPVAGFIFTFGTPTPQGTPPPAGQPPTPPIA